MSLSRITPLLLQICFIACSNQSHFYLSPSGNDAWSGRLATANRTQTDGPFRTLARAQQAVRANQKPATVYFRDGIYPIDQTIAFNAQDSGNKNAPVCWTAFPNEQPRLNGGQALTHFHKITDEKISLRLQPAIRDCVLVCDLTFLNIERYNDPPMRMSLFFQGKRMQPARYPNQGWLLISDVPQQGEKMFHPGDHKVIKFGLPAGRHFGRFKYDDDRPASWQPSGDVWMHGYWVWDWRDTYQKISHIVPTEKLIYPAEPHHAYGYEKGQRYYYLNVLEELDVPGEWYLDIHSHQLYFYPPGPINENDVMLSLLNDSMIELKNCSHLVFKNLTFECANGPAVRVLDGNDNLIAGCTIRNFGSDTAVVIRGGHHNTITGCEVHDVGGTAIKISGGDKKRLTAANLVADNNHIHDYGQMVHMFNTGIWLEGVANTVRHNKIHTCPGSGIQYYGNDHLIEFNELYDLAHESGDVGGMNTGADYTDQGTTIRYNYIHHCHGRGEGGIRGIYLDLPGSNTTIYGNILYKVDIGVFFNSGRDNRVQNNIFVECQPSIGIYLWPHKQYFQPGGPWKIVEKMHAYDYQNPPYSTRYPKLPAYLDEDLGMPYGHEISHNISYGGTWLDLSELMDPSRLTVKNNLICDSLLLVVTKKWTPDYDPYHIGYAAVYDNKNAAAIQEMESNGNKVHHGDPGFVDAARGDFRLKDDSPAWKLGFKKIPIEKIGLYIDQYRKAK